MTPEEELRLQLCNVAKHDQNLTACMEWYLNIGQEIMIVVNQLNKMNNRGGLDRVISNLAIAGLGEAVTRVQAEQRQPTPSTPEADDRAARNIKAAKQQGDIVLHLEKTDEPGHPWDIQIALRKDTPYAAIRAAAECLMGVCIEKGSLDSTQILQSLCIGAVHNARMEKTSETKDIPFVDPKAGGKPQG